MSACLRFVGTVVSGRWAAMVMAAARSTTPTGRSVYSSGLLARPMWSRSRSSREMVAALAQCRSAIPCVADGFLPETE